MTLGELVLIGAALATAGAVVIAIPIAAVRKATIEQIAATKYDRNPDLATALLRQRRYAGVGIVMVIVGTIMQTLGSTF